MKVEILGRPECGYCTRAVELCQEHRVPYTYTDIYDDQAAMQRIMDIRANTVPQIWIDGEHVGGFRQLEERMEKLNAEE